MVSNRDYQGFFICCYKIFYYFLVVKAFFVRCLFCRSRLMHTLVRTAKYVNWPGTVMVSGCPSDWTPLSACFTLTPFSTFRMSTLNLTSARCWVRLSAGFKQIFTEPSFRQSFGCPRVVFDFGLFLHDNRYGQTGFLICKDHNSYDIM